MKQRRWCWLLAVVTQTTACSSSDPVDLGERDPQPSESLGASLSDYAGSWDGYVEAFKFADDTDRIRVVLDRNGAGHFEAGNDVAPLPAPDPNEYPPGWIQEQPGPPNPTAGFMVPGYEYPVVDAKVASRRIQLQTSTLEMFRGWCELQTPVLDSVNTDQEYYSCVENAGYTVENNRCYLGQQTLEEFPCAKLACQYLCTCSADGCTAIEASDIQLDAAFDPTGTELMGTLVVPAGGRVAVRMTRQ